MTGFISPEGDFDDIFITDFSLIDNLSATGSLWIWGQNNDGGSGTNNITEYSSPVQTVTYGTNWRQVAPGGHTAAIKTDGTLWMWGRNDYGQLGTNDRTKRSSPIQTVAFGTNWKQVSLQGIHTAAIKTDSTLWVWGYNNFGSLGTNNLTLYSSPVQTIAFGNTWKQVSVGSEHMGATKVDGTLWMWGNQSLYGQLGTNDVTPRSSPVQTVAFGTNWKLVNCGQDHTAAIKNDGTLWLWGSNYDGQLGTNNVTNRSSPVQTIAYGSDWKQVSCGAAFTAAIKINGTLWMWGGNTYGPLGTNDRTRRSSPIQTVAYGTNWKQVSLGYTHTTAIKTDGTLWVWGQNADGQLGTNGLINTSSPVQTAAYGANWKQVSAGPYNTGAVYFNSAGSDYPSMLS